MYPRRICDATDAEEAQFVAMQLAQMALEPQVPPPPLVSLDQMIQSANPIGVLNSQGGFIEHLLARARRGDSSAHQFKNLKSPATAGADSLRQSLLPFDDLRPADRLECAAFLSAPNKVFWGKYFLCQTISSAIRDVGIEVIVTDPAGSAAMRLVLYNYSAVEKSVLEVNFDEILPPGSFLVLKNPCWMSTPSGWLVLFSENPQEVELISKKRVEAKFPGLEWIGTIPTEEIHYSQKRHFWKDLKDEAAAFGKLKGLGNKGFLDKRFSDALRFYDMALEYCAENGEDRAMIHSNKSAALLALGCFGAALKCAEVALEVSPGSEKYNYRKTKALIGLRKYEEGLSFLKQKFDQFSSLSKNKDCNTLLENVKFLASRKNLGPTESQLLAIRMNTLSKEEIIPEFISPSTVISKIEGKNRGLIATEDIRAGQLLICTRALVYHTTPISQAETLAEQMSGKIGNMLIFDRELGPELYNLTAGADHRGHLEPGDARTADVDLARILGIVNANMFGTGDEVAEMGLWVAPSFLNHSCSEHNAVWDVCGEWLAVRAIAEVKKGEELTIAYQSPIVSYEDRQTFFNNQGFTCACSLCQLEASEPPSVRKERAKILTSIEKLPTNCGPKEIKAALKSVEKLVSLRKEHVPLNFPLLTNEVGRLRDILFMKGRIGDEISLIKQRFDVADISPCWHTEGISLAIQLITCYAVKGDKESAKMWMANAKALMMKFYGNFELMRFNGKVALRGLKERFGIDFFKDELN